MLALIASRVPSPAEESAVGDPGFLTLAILTGLFWSQSARGHYWSGDPKEWSALLAWCLYIVLIVTRYRTGWGGRRAAVAGMAGFAAMVFTFAWTLSRGPGAG